MPGSLNGIGGALGLGNGSGPRVGLWERVRRRLTGASGPPTVFHIPHHKSGSQWIHRILLPLAGERLVAPEVENAQFLDRPIEPGKVYPTVYVTREQFDTVRTPPNSR